MLAVESCQFRHVDEFLLFFSYFTFIFILVLVVTEKPLPAVNTNLYLKVRGTRFIFFIQKSHLMLYFAMKSLYSSVK